MADTEPSGSAIAAQRLAAKDAQRRLDQGYVTRESEKREIEKSLAESLQKVKNFGKSKK